MDEPEVEVLEVDVARAEVGQALVELLDAYSRDLAVLPAHRGQGVGRRLLEAVAAKGRALGCCKLTLEVLENNQRALRVYAAAGFQQAVYRQEAGGAIFMVKKL